MTRRDAADFDDGGGGDDDDVFVFVFVIIVHSFCNSRTKHKRQNLLSIRRVKICNFYAVD